MTEHKNHEPREELTFRKSSRSFNGACVEVAPAADRVVVRDSKDPGGPQLSFSRAEWERFLAGQHERTAE